MRILVTNDDGIDSEGLAVLVASLRGLGELVVVAPDREYSGASASLGPLGGLAPEAHRVDLTGAGQAWSVSGPPALCVLLATLGVFGEPKFDLVVSGINPGANVGRAIYHSGTVGAALTARSRGVSAVAVSQAVEGFGVEGQGWDEMLANMHWETAGQVARAAAGALGAAPAARAQAAVVVNLNVPNLELSEVKGWERASLGSVPPRVVADARLEPKLGHPGVFKVFMRWGDAEPLPEGTDGAALEAGRVSLSMLAPMSEVSVAHDARAEEAAMAALAPALSELVGPRSDA